MSTKFRVSHLRCVPSYRHNDITVIIIGKPNSVLQMEVLGRSGK